jgi:hypothetical protein
VPSTPIDGHGPLALAVALAAQGRMRPFAGPILPRGVVLGTPSTSGGVGTVRNTVRPQAGVVGGHAGIYLSLSEREDIRPIESAIRDFVDRRL